MADTLCRQVIEVVRSGMAKGEVSVTAVASKLNMGEQTFRRRFVCETGQQPKMFITAIQMDLAARLLLQDSSRPVGEVARECGFDEASAFSHAFKKAYACSPTQYRQGASPANIYIYIIRYNASKGSWLVFLKNVLQVVDDGLQALLYLWLLQIVDMLGRQGGEGVETTHLHHRGNG